MIQYCQVHCSMDTYSAIMIPKSHVRGLQPWAPDHLPSPMPYLDKLASEPCTSSHRARGSDCRRRRCFRSQLGVRAWRRRDPAHMPAVVPQSPDRRPGTRRQALGHGEHTQARRRAADLPGDKVKEEAIDPRAAVILKATARMTILPRTCRW